MWTFSSQLTRLSCNAVKALASELIKDHTKALHAKVKLAKALRVAVPTHPNPLQQAQLKMLRKLRGSKFDKAWLQVQLAAHKLAIAAAKKEVLAGANKAVKAEAARELPVLQHHLKQVVALLALYTKPAVVLAQPVRAHDSSATSSGY